MPRPFLVTLMTAICVVLMWTVSSNAIVPLKIEIFFDGGNAYVQSRATPGAVTVGAVAQQEPAHHYNRHRMKLQLEQGSVARTGTTLLAQEGTVPTLPDADAWDLHGWKVEICPEGACLSANTLKLPQEKASLDNCEDEKENLSLLPNFNVLHNGKLVASDWADRLDSELRLREGELKVPGAKNCFEFRRNAEKKIRNVSGASKDVNWVYEGKGTYVDLELKPKFGKMTARTIRLIPNPQNGTIQLRVTTTLRNYPRPEPTEEVEHFQQFYSLFDSGVIQNTERWKMFAKIIKTEITPGTECPPAFLIAP